MTTTCSSPFRRTPTIPPRRRPSPTPTAILSSSGTGNLFNGIRVAGKDSPYGRAIYAADKNNLQPRIGAAWDPGGAGRLIVRAGYGMYFDQTQVGMFAQNVQEYVGLPTRFARIVFVSNAAALESRAEAR